jgi:tRNA pseudouridine32 synthase / 23S rRNA pseudouridine746 synthase
MSQKMTNNNSTEKRIEKHLPVLENDITAIDLLAEHTNFSRQKLKQIMHKGAVWLSQIDTQHNTTIRKGATKRLRRASKKLKTGQSLHLYYDDDILSDSDLKAILIADESDYSVWFKPAGMLSQGSKYGDHCTLYRWAETHLKPQRNAFIVHRLDKATSGIQLIAHSKHAASALALLFSERKTNKFYKALVHGTLTEMSANSKTQQKPLLIETPLDGKQASTIILSSQVKQNETFTNSIASLLDLQILTGRKHQIRQHLAGINHPIIGDRLYGSGVKDNCDLCLTAYKLSFVSPFDNQKKHYELSDEAHLNP